MSWVLALGTGYLLLYILCDWISFIEPYRQLNITPWNPCTGVSFAFILLAGRRYAPLLLSAPLLSDAALRGLSTPLHVAVVLSLLSGAVCIVVAHLLVRPRFRFDLSCTTLRDVLLLVGAALGVGAISACGEVGVLVAVGLLDSSDIVWATLRQCVGDVIGIVVTVPFILLLAKRRLNLPDAISWLQLASIVVIIALSFGVAHAVPVRIFYMIILPIIWMALVSGLEGVAVGLIVTQLGLMAALYITGNPAAPITAWQVLMTVVAVTGLIVGAVVSDRRKAEQRVRLLQDAQARFNRLGSLGAFSAALTHEINQPLSAASTYSRLTLEALSADRSEVAAARVHAAKAVAEIQRAAGVVRRMHDFILMGRSELSSVEPARLVAETVGLLQPEIDRAQVRLITRIAPELPRVNADIQQIDQVLINLVHNSVEAIGDAGRGPGKITIAVERTDGGFVQLSVEDTGPGFTSEQLSQSNTPFTTSKLTGLGIGLALCESIIEGHGGKLQLGNTASGAIVRFTLREASEGFERRDVRRSPRS